VAVGRRVQDRRTEFEAGASVARLALANGVNTNRVFSWHRQHRQGLLGQRNAEPVKLLPVHVSESQTAKRIDREASK
jgi:transposase-like protein